MAQIGSPFDWKKEISKIYYDVKSPGSFFGPTQIYKILKKKDSSCTLKAVTQWLRDQPTYNIHRSRKFKFQRRPLVRVRPYETLSSDIVFLQDLARYNANYAYILTVRCLFSNYAWCFPLKKKTQAETSAALSSLFEKLDGEIDHFWVDSGAEFDLDIFEKYDINKYTVNSNLKACHIENFNKILENRIYRTLTANCSLKWIMYLEDIVESYNNTPSKRLYGLTPKEALESPHREFLKKKFVEERKVLEKKYEAKAFDIKEGMLVHVSKLKKQFSRGYKPVFHEKPRKVVEILKTFPPTIQVAGVKRSLYRAEVAPTTESTTERPRSFYILKERKIGGRQLRSQNLSGQTHQYLIKSYTDPDFQDWVDEAEVRRLEKNNVLHNYGQWFK